MVSYCSVRCYVRIDGLNYQTIIDSYYAIHGHLDWESRKISIETDEF